MRNKNTNESVLVPRSLTDDELNGGGGLSEDQLESVAGGSTETLSPSELASRANSYTPEWTDWLFRRRT